MWHASGNGRGNRRVSRQIARAALHGVGDPSLGEWVEDGAKGIVHVRRRLSPREQEEFGILELVDVRGTDTEVDRLAAVLTDAPYLAPYFGAMP